MNIEDRNIKELITLLKPKQLWSLIIFCLSLLSASFYFGNKYSNFISNETIHSMQTTIDHYKHEWSRIEPQIELQQRFNLRDKIIDKFSSNIPEGAESIENNFFALKNTPGLQFQKNALEEYQSLFNNEINSICMDEFYKLAPIYLWKGKSLYHIEGDSPFRKMFPHIKVQKIGKARLESKIIKLVDCLYSPDGQCSDETSSQDTSIIKSYLNKYSGRIEELDIVGTYWAFWEYQNLLNSVFDPNFEWESTQTQKTRKSLFATNVYKYENIDLYKNKKKINEPLYIKVQTMIAVTSNHIYYIQIVLPTIKLDENKEFKATSNMWLSSLRLIND